MSAEEEAAELHWFAKWEEDFPSPEELMPLSQSLITPSLAAAFDIPTAAANQDGPSPSSAAKKPRLVWTPQLHKRFVEAISRLGIKNAVPKTIMQLMNVEGLTRENVASHLQKYRLYLRRVQMQSAAASPSSPSASAFIIDAAADRLFATAPVPRQFLAGPFAPYQPIAAAAAQQNQYYQQQRHAGLVMREHPQVLALKQPMQNPYVHHYLAPGREDGRRALNLFPTGLD